MSALLTKYCNGRNVIVLLLAANLVYLLMLFVTIPQVMAWSHGMNLFDMMPLGYDLAYAKTLLETLGEEGRSVYLTHQLPLDMLYPGLSGMAYGLLMCWIFQKLTPGNNLVPYLCLIPVIAGLFDYLENFGIILMIASYPGISSFQVGLVCSFSVIKSMLSTLFFVILLLAFFGFLFKYFTIKRSRR